MAGRSEVLIILRAVNQASGAIKGVNKDLDNLFVDALKGTAIIAATAAVAKAAYDFGKEGAQIERLRTTGTKLAASFEVDMARAVKAVKDASLGTITSNMAVAEVNRLLLLGITTDVDKMAKLMSIAALRGRAFGLDTQEAFDRITLGIGRLSTRILDDIGIVIDGETAYARFGASIGKTANQLTEQEKRHAILNAIIEDGNVLLEATGGLTDDNATKIARMETTLTDLGNTLKEGVAPYVANFSEGLSGILNLLPNLSDTLEDHRRDILASKDAYILYNQELERNAFLQGIVDTALGGLRKNQEEVNRELLTAIRLYRTGEKLVYSLSEALKAYHAGEKAGPGSAAQLQRDTKALEKTTQLRNKSLEIQAEFNKDLVQLNQSLEDDLEDLALDFNRQQLDLATDLARDLEDIELKRTRDTEDYELTHKRKMVDIEKTYQRDISGIMRRFELAKLRALIDLDARALFEAEAARDADLADAQQTRKTHKKEESDSYKERLDDRAAQAERERQDAIRNNERQRADAKLDFDRRRADAQQAWARRYGDLSRQAQQEFTLFVQSQQGIIQFLRASYAQQETDLLQHQLRMTAITYSQTQDLYSLYGARGQAASLATGTLNLNVGISGTGNMSQMINQQVYSAMYDIFTLPGGQVVYKLKQ